MAAAKDVPGWMTEIRYFYLRQTTCPLSPHAQAMWQYLMYRANAVWWHFPLVLRLGELAGALNMSVSMVKKARQELSDGRYILHERQQGNRAAKYFIVSNCSGEWIGKLPVMAVGESQAVQYAKTRVTG